jgi:general secretion pathway protein G
MMMLSKGRGTGFTLIEVLLVIVILAGLATVAFVTLSGRGEEAKAGLTKVRMQKIRGWLEDYKRKFNTYPSEDQGGLEALVKKPAFDNPDFDKAWRPYTTNPDDLKDEWGKEFRYEVVDDDSSGVTIKVVHLTSGGPDGDLDTDEDNVKSWKEASE